MGRNGLFVVPLMALLISGASCSAAKERSQATTSLSQVVRVGPAPPADTVKDTPWSGIKACDLMRTSDIAAAGVPGAIGGGYDDSADNELPGWGGNDPSSCYFSITVASDTSGLEFAIDNGGGAQYQRVEQALSAFRHGKLTSVKLTGLGDRASLWIQTPEQLGQDPRAPIMTSATVLVLRGKHVVGLTSTLSFAGPKELETLTAWAISRFGPPAA